MFKIFYKIKRNKNWNKKTNIELNEQKLKNLQILPKIQLKKMEKNLKKLKKI